MLRYSQRACFKSGAGILPAIGASSPGFGDHGQDARSGRLEARPTTQSCRLFKQTLSPIAPLVGGLFLTSIVAATSASPPSPVLAVPTVSRPLHLRVAAPPALKPALGRAWQLLELEHPGGSVPATLAPAWGADGALAPGRRQLVATIPPRAEAKGNRRFELKTVEGVTPPETYVASFRFADVDEKSLGLWEGQQRVLAYNQGVISKSGVAAGFSRSTYVHPLYGLDGEVLTDDFPEDHLHHRGLFWAWPHVTVGDQHHDLWALQGIRQQFDHWLARETSDAVAVLGVENGWYVGEQKVMTERVWFHVYPASRDERAIDVDLTWIPLRQPVTLAGAEGKSYGGLTLRFAPRTQTVITTPQGNASDDAYMTRLAWADLSAQFASAPQPSGAAILIAPDHPDYPPTWLTRHYGVLCVGWPGVTAKTFPVGAPIRCCYRVWIHRAEASAMELVRAYEAFKAGEGVKWEPTQN
jgi:hypothetical protein